MAATKTFTLEEVAQHNSAQSLWIVIRGVVYDFTSYLEAHPGGMNAVLALAGKDATKDFELLHKASVLDTHGPRLRIGVVAGHAPIVPRKTTAFGVDIPFAEPFWYRAGVVSPDHYKQTHRDFRALMRSFVDEQLMPFCHQWDEDGGFPADLAQRAYAAGVFGAIWPKEIGGTPPPNADIWHELIYWDELARTGCGGLIASCFFTIKIALPPVLYGANPELKARVVADVVTGREVIALAISEPFAGSDVARVRTTGRRDGDFYVINGVKKFITGGMKAKYFTTAVQTESGVSVILIERGPGVDVRRLKTMGWWASNTAQVSFENVRVPVSNILGEEGCGFQVIMQNFNHERWAGAVGNVRAARVCIEDSIRFARRRETFGQPLIKHQVIRHKIANMAREVDTAQSLMEHCTQQLCSGAAMDVIAGSIAMAKIHTGKVLEMCAREACQIFGGASYIRGGIAERVERIYREVRVVIIGGGSEEIMTNLIASQARL